MVGPAVSWIIEDNYVDARGELRTADPATIAAITACLAAKSDGNVLQGAVSER